MTTTRARLRSRIVTAAAAAATVAAVAGALSGCGSSSPQPSSGEAPQGAQTTRAQIDPAQRQAINDCLQAAGLPTPTPVMRTAQPGSGAPPAGGQGGPGAQFASPEARAALEACGIQVPTPAPAP